MRKTPGLCSLELNFSLFLRHPGGVGLDRNRTFFVKYALKSQALYAASPVKTAKARASVCLTVKNVLSLNSSRNNSSVDDVDKVDL